MMMLSEVAMPNVDNHLPASLLPASPRSASMFARIQGAFRRGRGASLSRRDAFAATGNEFSDDALVGDVRMLAPGAIHGPYGRTGSIDDLYAAAEAAGGATAIDIR